MKKSGLRPSLSPWSLLSRMLRLICLSFCFLLAGDPAETAMAGICPLCYRLQQRSQPLLMLLQVRKIMSSRRPFAKHLADRSSGCLE